jgi:hypothetical protein
LAPVGSDIEFLLFRQTDLRELYTRGTSENSPSRHLGE